MEFLPLAIRAVIEEALGAGRCHLVQTSPVTIRIRLESEVGMDSKKFCIDVSARLNAYLAEQQLANVELVRRNGSLERSARSTSSPRS